MKNLAGPRQNNLAAKIHYARAGGPVSFRARNDILENASFFLNHFSHPWQPVRPGQLAFSAGPCARDGVIPFTSSHRPRGNRKSAPFWSSLSAIALMGNLPPVPPVLLQRFSYDQQTLTWSKDGRLMTRADCWRLRYTNFERTCHCLSILGR